MLIGCYHANALYTMVLFLVTLSDPNYPKPPHFRYLYHFHISYFVVGGDIHKGHSQGHVTHFKFWDPNDISGMAQASPQIFNTGRLHHILAYG